MAKYVQVLYVDRENTKNREETLNNISQRIKDFEENKNEVPITLFPEGTTTNGTALLEFKKGAFIHLKPIKLIGI